MANAFYLRLALTNVQRSREVYLPYFLTTTIMAGVYFLILALIYSPGMTNLPSGETAQAVFTMGIAIFTLFAFGFMLYINAFLVKRRKKEFGLFNVLGMSRWHVSRVLAWETLLVVGAGLITGIGLGIVFGRLMFLLLMKLMHVTVAGSTFQLPLAAFIGTGALFLTVFVATTLYNSLRIRLANTTDLLKSDQQGEKDSKLVLPIALLGLLLLGGAYYVALTTKIPAAAISFFFPTALIVIIATFALFHAGSIAFLRLLRKNKGLYYQPGNFVAISGMFHRMRQNARGLASICIISTMLLVTVAGTCSLYLGQEEMLRWSNPYDLKVYLDSGSEPRTPFHAENLDRTLGQLAAQNNLTLKAEADQRIQTSATRQNQGQAMSNTITRFPDSAFQQLQNAFYLDGFLYLDMLGKEADAENFVAAFTQYVTAEYPNSRVIDIFTARAQRYALFGGLLFLGAFFTILFLAMTVLMIYFKQITEGNEDKERFNIMQKVGMQDLEVKSAINRQILWVFFLPLFLAICHILAASKMISKMIEAFGMYNLTLTLLCILITSLIFALVYFLVYQQTAKTYYRIVKW